MQHIKNLSDSELLSQIQSLVSQERRITLSVLHHLREVERRRLYALKHSSLFAYCIEELRYSEPAASRRINAMRLLSEIPEMESQMESGQLSVTTASKAQSFFKNAKKIENKCFSKDEKRELVSQIQNKTSYEQDKVFAEISPQAAAQKTVRALDSNHTELRIVVDEELMQALKRIKEVCAHKLNGKSDYASLLKLMAEITLQKTDPEKKQTKSNFYSAELKQKPSANPRYIPVYFKREVWRRYSGRCGYKIPGTNKTCGSCYALEIDHILPLALGGKTELENLRLVCKTHNLLFAQQSFGRAKLDPYFLQKNKITFQKQERPVGDCMRTGSLIIF